MGSRRSRAAFRESGRRPGVFALPYGASDWRWERHLEISERAGVGSRSGIVLRRLRPYFHCSLLDPTAGSDCRTPDHRAQPIALALIWAFAQGSTGLLEFGFGVPKLRYLALAVLIGLPLALAVGWLSHLLPSKGQFSIAGFRPWMLWLYFGLGASIQEEVIFRGLIQSYLERTWSTSVTRLAGRMSPTVCFTAVLFGVIHLDSGPIVVAGALGLGLVAGELRRCSHSLLPAVIVHALFNLPELLWR